MQPDSLIADYTNPQAWNRYSYVGNNPVNFSDPTGHYACGDGEEKECGTGKKQDPNKNPHSYAPRPKKDNGDKNAENHCQGLDCSFSHHDDNILTFTNSPADHQIDWAKVAEGTGLLIFLGALDYALIAGVVAFFPEIATAEEITIIIGVDSPWIMVGGFALIDAHISALNLIIEGFTGEKNKIPKLLVPRK